jgi:hypothetical protein
MPDRPLRAAVDELRGAIRQRLLDEEQGHLDLLASPGAEPRARNVAPDSVDPGDPPAEQGDPRE